MIKVTLQAQTEQIGRSNSTLEDHVEFSGLNAGVCYMPATFEALKSQPTETKIKRGKSTIGRTHHSVAGHVEMSVVIEDIPKICAMVLNNLGEYNTSEKSARYTVMQDVPAKELELYKKWYNKFVKLICKKYDCINPTLPNAMDLYKEKKCKLSPSQVDKLAMENARYMISVFTPTTMAYTTSIRQFNYIIDWCRRMFAEETENVFYMRVAKHMNDLADKLEEIAYVENLRDTKNRSFNLFDKDIEAVRNIEPFFGYAYQTIYKGSFAQLAQAQRHRTLDYKAYFDGNASLFYVPPIIADDEDLVKRWLSECTLLAGNFPQATLVDILEMGTVDNFLLKTKERECGCAQLEIQNQTVAIHSDYENAITDPVLIEKFEGYKKKVRCGFTDYECKSPCVWGLKSNERLI